VQLPYGKLNDAEIWGKHFTTLKLNRI
jgi:hypothetical protein